MNEQGLRKIAQNLYSGYQKDTTGQVAQLKDADPATRQLWLRAAKRAVKVIGKISGSPLDSATPGKKAAPDD